MTVTSCHWPAHDEIARELGLEPGCSDLWAHVERVGRCENQCSGLMRIFEDGQVYGSPYRYVFPFRMIDDHTVEVYGIAGRPPTPDEVRCALVECKRRGWRVVRERKCGARQGMREITRKKA